MGEVGAHLTGPLGMTSVRWLTSPELAVTCRTGFAPGDRAGIIDALAAHAVHPEVNADVPWAMAGPPVRTRRCGTTATTHGTPSARPSSSPLAVR